MQPRPLPTGVPGPGVTRSPPPTSSVKRGVLAVLVLALVGAGAFSAGRFSAPREVETRDVERVVYRDRVVEKVVTVEVKAKAETKIVYRDRVVTKEGEVRERIVERTDTKEDTHTDTAGDKTTTKVGSTEREATKVVTLQPTWRVSLLAGASLAQPLVPLAGPLVLGAEVDYRIAGGVSAGVWINTVGAAGLGVSLEF